MRHQLRALVVGSLTAAALAVVALSAASVNKNGITVHYPSYPISGPALLSCEPWSDSKANLIKIAGIPEGASVTVTFAWAAPFSGMPTYQPSATFSNVQGGTLVVPVNYPAETVYWPVIDPVTNERAIAIVALVTVNANGIMTKLSTPKWWIKCTAKPAPYQGCTRGYWGRPHHFDSWSGYATNDVYATVFGVTPVGFGAGTTLEDALGLPGGHENQLAAQAVAALLNAASPSVNYFYTVAQVIQMVQDAYASGDFEPTKDLFDMANNAFPPNPSGCPLN